MERKSEMTKALLGESFRELMMRKPFDKITIKMVTDGAGVIRPTFYNYFQDKYEVMEWMLHQDIFVGALELIHMDMRLEAVKMIFRKIEADKQYYIRAFEVEGQNSFEEMLFREILAVLNQVNEIHPINLGEYSASISRDVFLEFHAVTMMNGIKWWVLDREFHIDADEALKVYEFLMTHSFSELLDIKAET